MNDTLLTVLLLVRRELQTVVIQEEGLRTLVGLQVLQLLLVLVLQQELQVLQMLLVLVLQVLI